MTGTTPLAPIEHVSALPFEATLARLITTIEQAGLILFSQIDHQAGAHRAGLAMPPATVLIYGHPAGGTPVMLAAPLTALDLPLRVLVRERDDARTSIVFHPIGPVLRQAGVPETLAGKLDKAQDMLVRAVFVMTEQQILVGPGKPLLDYLPIGLFGAVMGLSGLSVAWRLAAARYGAPEAIDLSIAGLAVSAFLCLALAYLVKAVTALTAVRNEFRHPIAGNLFGTPLISLLLLPIVLEPHAPRLAQWVWVLGATGMVLFAWFIVSRWMSDRQQMAHATPAWIIPVVGLLDVPLALPSLGLPPMHGLMLFAVAVGLFFAVPLFTLIFARLLFEAPLPDALKPSLLILVAPFAVGYSAYTVTVGQTDLFAEALYMLTLFMLAVLLGQLRNLPLCCPFRVSWWAVSFPLAASSIAALRFAAAQPGTITDAIALALLALATLVIAALLARTLLGLARGELRTLSA